MEWRVHLLWLPPGSEFVAHQSWLADHFPEGHRRQAAIFRAPENILHRDRLLDASHPS